VTNLSDLSLEDAKGNGKYDEQWQCYIVSISGFGLKENQSSMTYSVSVISLKEMDKGGYAAGRERDYQLLQPWAQK
jgi:hypothetical protein